MYARWSHIGEGSWKTAADEVESARKLLEAVEGVAVENLPIAEEPGRISFACAFKEAVDGWANETAELALDSTCKSFILHRTTI